MLAPATRAALPSTRAIPDRDVFYVAFPKSSIRSFPPLGSLTATLAAVTRDRLLQRHDGKNLKAEFT
jgi:hypothetical protein